jgi:BCD family chlorophyll transporter-like MFS transporter
MIIGCLMSGGLLLALSAAGFAGDGWPLTANVFALGVANGTFAVAAIGSMMELMSSGAKNRDGMRMGLWGAAQAIAFGLGGILGTLAVDVTRFLTGSTLVAYAGVFAAQAAMFVLAALLAAQLTRRKQDSRIASATPTLMTEAGST